MNRDSHKSIIESHIVDSYTDYVEDNNSYKNKRNVSIGSTIKGALNPNSRDQPIREPTGIQTISVNNVK